MPKDLYRWEDSGSLVHHCPVCAKPLNNPQARTRCLGEHVEWCKGYHTQLFRKDTSSQCDPCRRADEEHRKRHTEIAELVLELKPSVDDAIQSPFATKSGSTTADTSDSSENTPKTTKRERKALKRAHKLLERKKSVTSADIDFVASILHPCETSTEDVNAQDQLLNDRDFKVNCAYHKGTSNIREVRHELIKMEKYSSGENEPCTSAEEMEDILQRLGVPRLAAKATCKEKAAREELKRCISKDIVQAQKEAELLAIRKAGFWRWASKKAYNRFVENRLETGQERPTEPVTDPPDLNEREGGGVDEVVVSGLSSVSLEKGGSKTKKPTEVRRLKLAHNGGLEKLVQPVSASPRSGW